MKLSVGLKVFIVTIDILRSRFCLSLSEHCYDMPQGHERIIVSLFTVLQV